jgi:hypothetical protein
MPRRMVDLFTCWRGLSGKPQSSQVWKMVPFYLLWCIWREINDRSFENCKRMVVDLKPFFFNTPYHWKAALDFPNLIGFHDFLEHFSLSS